MVNKGFMNKAMASAISGIIFSSPILANTNAMETSKVEGVIKTTIETNREENQSIIYMKLIWQKVYSLQIMRF